MKIRQPWLISPLAFFLAGVMRLWMGTLRFRYRPQGPNVDPRSSNEERYIYAFWHESLLMPTSIFGHRVCALVSQHADGELVTQICKHLRIKVVRGSSTRGAVQGVRSMLKMSGSCHLALPRRAARTEAARSGGHHLPGVKDRVADRRRRLRLRAAVACAELGSLYSAQTVESRGRGNDHADPCSPRCRQGRAGALPPAARGESALGDGDGGSDDGRAAVWEGRSGIDGNSACRVSETLLLQPDRGVAIVPPSLVINEQESEPVDVLPVMTRNVRGALLGMVIGLAIVFTIALRLDPYQGGHTWNMETHTQLGLPPCNFKVLTGLPCPSCGMTTSFALLMKGDVAGALRANSVGALLAVLCLALIPWGLATVVRGQPLFIRSMERTVTWILAGVLVAHAAPAGRSCSPWRGGTERCEASLRGAERGLGAEPGGMAMTTTHRRWWLPGFLLAVAVATGCNMLSLPFFLMVPEPRADAQLKKIASEDKKKTVKAVIVTWSPLDPRSELLRADRELSEKLAEELHAGFEFNEEKVTLIPTRKVQEFKNQHPGWRDMDLADIGKQFQADFVIYLEIEDLNLYKQGSFNDLFQGHIRIAVTVAEVGNPDGRAVDQGIRVYLSDRGQGRSGQRRHRQRSRAVPRTVPQVRRQETLLVLHGTSDQGRLPV